MRLLEVDNAEIRANFEQLEREKQEFEQSKQEEVNKLKSDLNHLGKLSKSIVSCGCELSASLVSGACTTLTTYISILWNDLCDV